MSSSIPRRDTFSVRMRSDSAYSLPSDESASTRRNPCRALSVGPPRTTRGGRGAQPCCSQCPYRPNTTGYPAWWDRPQILPTTWRMLIRTSSSPCAAPILHSTSPTRHIESSCFRQSWRPRLTARLTVWMPTDADRSGNASSGLNPVMSWQRRRIAAVQRDTRSRQGIRYLGGALWTRCRLAARRRPSHSELQDPEPRSPGRTLSAWQRSPDTFRRRSVLTVAPA
jgi:hypothetical protein